MHRPELVAFALAGVVVVAAAARGLAGEPVPSWFPIVALAAVTGGAGLAIPGAAAGGEATSSGEPTTVDGWTLADVSSWIETELVPKIERALARSHVHVAPTAPTAAPLPPEPTNVAQTAPTAPTAPATQTTGP